MEILQWYLERTKTGTWYSRKPYRSIEYVGATKEEALSFHHLLCARDVAQPEYYATFTDERAGKVTTACEKCGQVPAHPDGQSCADSDLGVRRGRVFCSPTGD